MAARCATVASVSAHRVCTSHGRQLSAAQAITPGRACPARRPASRPASRGAAPAARPARGPAPAAAGQGGAQGRARAWRKFGSPCGWRWKKRRRQLGRWDSPRRWSPAAQSPRRSSTRPRARPHLVQAGAVGGEPGQEDEVGQRAGRARQRAQQPRPAIPQVLLVAGQPRVGGGAQRRRHARAQLRHARRAPPLLQVGCVRGMRGQRGPAV